MMLHFNKNPLIINNEVFYFDHFSDETLFLQNDANENLHRIALTLWPERKILLGVGCNYNQDGYVQALNMLKNEKLIKES